MQFTEEQAQGLEMLADRNSSKHHGLNKKEAQKILDDFSHGGPERFFHKGKFYIAVPRDRFASYLDPLGALPV